MVLGGPPLRLLDAWRIALGGRSSELVVDDVVNEAGCGCEAQLIEYPTLVGADGLSAEVQFSCDLAAMPAGCNGQQDFGFLGREIGVGGNGPRIVNSPADRFTEMLLALEDIPDSVEESGTAGALGDITGGAKLQGTGGVERIGVHAEHEDGGLGTAGTNLPQDEKAVLAGKTDIEDHETPGLEVDLSNGFIGAPGLAKGEVAELVAQYLLQALTKEQMVIDDQNRQFLRMLHDSEQRFPVRTGQAAATILGVSGLIVKRKNVAYHRAGSKAAK